MKKERNYLNNKTISISSIILLIAGLIVFFYPTVSNYLAEKNQSQVIEKYEDTVSSTYSEINIEEELEKAKIYNENIAGEPLHDPFVEGSGYALPQNYLEIINIDGIMGYIDIPKISVNLPIYHGTSEEVLEKGVGHIDSTSIPIGGDQGHAVLTGHRGLSSAKLFTDLNKMEEGDLFFIHILDRILAYKVYEIEVIEPTEIENLQLIPNRDIVTLVTCTPYGINTHRLLVHAERTEYVEQEEIEEKEEVKEKNNDILRLIIGISIVIILIIVTFTIECFITFKKGKRRK